MINHLGIIMDGNRRFAKKLMLQPWKGHEWGAKKVHSMMEWAHERNIKELTFYTFSRQNFNRPALEKKYLFDLFKKEFVELNNPENLAKLSDNGIKIRFIGTLSLFGKELHKEMITLMENTKDNTGMIANFAMAYGGREELLDAMNAIAVKIREGTLQEITEDVVNSHLYNASEPDLILRTGGEKRTSNFLPWQSTYSEFCFVDIPWPSFSKEDFTTIVNDYEDRERRFGK